MRGTVAKRIRKSIEVGLNPEDLISLFSAGKYNQLYRRLKRGYTRGDVNATQLANYYGELEKLATSSTGERAISTDDRERIAL